MLRTCISENELDYILSTLSTVTIMNNKRPSYRIVGSEVFLDRHSHEFEFRGLTTTFVAVHSLFIPKAENGIQGMLFHAGFEDDICPLEWRSEDIGYEEDIVGVTLLVLNNTPRLGAIKAAPVHFTLRDRLDDDMCPLMGEEGIWDWANSNFRRGAQNY